MLILKEICRFEIGSAAVLHPQTLTQDVFIVSSEFAF